MKTRDQIYGQEAARLLRDVTMYRALTKPQLLALYPGKKEKIAALLNHLVRQGRIFYDSTNDCYHADAEMKQDAGMMAAVWVLIDFIEEVEFHSVSDYPAKLLFFAGGEVYEVIYVPLNQEALINQLWVQKEEQPPRRIVLVDMPAPWKPRMVGKGGLRMRRYLKPRDNGYLMEAAACSKLLKELRRIEAKFVRAVEKETAIRQSEFETVMRYSSEQEILDDYGWGFLTEAQYDRYRELYEKGRAALEDLPPTQNKLTLQLVRRIIADLDAERREWEFSALSPEDQRAELDRAQRAQNEWKEKIAELKRQLDWDDPQEQKEGVK